MSSGLLWVFWWWWIPICGGFVVGWVFLFGFCGRWLFKVVGMAGLIWGGFEMEVVMGFDLGWICSEVVVGYEVVIGIFGFEFYWCGFGWVLLPVVVTGFLWPEVVAGFSGRWWWWWVPIWNEFAMGVVLGFDVVVSFLCVGGFGYCWSRFDWVLVWVVKLCCGPSS